MKRTKNKAARELVTRRIVYRNHKRPHDRPRELKVDVSRKEAIDADYAAAMVATRTTTSLADVTVLEIGEPD